MITKLNEGCLVISSQDKKEFDFNAIWNMLGWES